MILLAALGVLGVAGWTVARVRQHLAAQSGRGPIELHVKDVSELKRH